MPSFKSGDVLSNSPLVLVLTQVQFPYPVRRLVEDNRDFEKRMEEIGFPFAEQQEELSFELDAQGTPLPQETKREVRRVFHSTDTTSHVVVTRQSITLYVTSAPEGPIPYEGRAAFANKFGQVVKAVEDCTPSTKDLKVARVAYRYVNLIDSVEQAVVGKLISAPFRDFAFLSGPQSGVGNVLSASTQVVIGASAPDAPTRGQRPAVPEILQVRSGILQPGDFVDPAVAPRDEACWVVDLDSFTTRESRFNKQEMEELVLELAQRARSFFFATLVQDAFIQEFE